MRNGRNRQRPKKRKALKFCVCVCVCACPRWSNKSGPAEQKQSLDADVKRLPTGPSADSHNFEVPIRSRCELRLPLREAHVRTKPKCAYRVQRTSPRSLHSSHSLAKSRQALGAKIMTANNVSGNEDKGSLGGGGKTAKETEHREAASSSTSSWELQPIRVIERERRGRRHDNVIELEAPVVRRRRQDGYLRSGFGRLLCHVRARPQAQGFHFDPSRLCPGL
jgi:hypothetical protein